MTPGPTDHVIWFVVFDGVQTLDLTGPMEMFVTANRILDAADRAGRRYVVRTVHPTAETVVTEAGLRLVIDRPDPDEQPDTVVVTGGDGVHDALTDPTFEAWSTDLLHRTPRVASVCTGSFVLASSGVADGRTLTTHWARADRLARQHPTVHVDGDRLHIHDGPVWSSAGVTAGIDLALAMIEHDHDAELAQLVARWMVVFLRRSGGQSQFATPVWSEAAETEPIGRAKELVHQDPSHPWTMDTLATAVGMSERNFSRRFRAEVGETPARYVEQIRLDVARTQLERGSAGLEAVARHAGFGSAETMRRTFSRRLGISPDQYRTRFRLEETTS